MTTPITGDAYTDGIRSSHISNSNSPKQLFLRSCTGYMFIREPIKLFTFNYMPSAKLFPSPKSFKLLIPNFMGGNNNK